MTQRSTDNGDEDYSSLREKSSSWVSKDWIIAILVSIVGALSLLGLNNVSTQLSEQKMVVSVHTAQIAILTQSNVDIIRRLDLIDMKLDKLLGWKQRDTN